jgi:hypothetical protein
VVYHSAGCAIAQGGGLTESAGILPAMSALEIVAGHESRGTPLLTLTRTNSHPALFSHIIVKTAKFRQNRPVISGFVYVCLARPVFPVTRGFTHFSGGSNGIARFLKLNIEHDLRSKVGPAF